MATDRARYSVLAVDRVLRILKCFTSSNPQLGYLEVAEQTGIPQSTTYKLMQLLLEEGFLERDETNGTYRVGRELFRLGELFLSSRSLVDVANPWLEKLVKRLGFTASLGVLDQDSLITILTRFGTSPLSLSRDPALGRRSPVYLSALGKALILDMQRDELECILPTPPWPKCAPNSITTLDQLMMDLQEARRLGCTQDNEETAIGMRCVGHPVRDHQGEIVAAISVSATTIEITDDSLPQIVETVKEIGTNISTGLGYDTERIY